MFALVPVKLIWLQKQKPETGETWQVRRFWKGIISKEGKEAQLENKTWANSHTTEAQTQQEAHSAKERTGRANPSAGAPGARPHPPLCRLGPRCGGLVINRGLALWGWIREYPPKLTRQPLYKRGREGSSHTPHYTHHTLTWAPSLHSLCYN
jgi:hypothetical protein